MRYKLDPLVIALMIAVALAYFFPQPTQIADGELLEWIITIGIGFIFFFYGLKLSTQEIKSGIKNWKLHLMIQGFTFIVFPLIILCFYPLVKSQLSFNFWLSFFFLASLPSTVSTSVVLTSIARGNVPAAIFNASISGLIGVIVTPLWMALFLSFSEETSFHDIYIKLILQIIVPAALGVVLQKKGRAWAKRNSRHLSNFDKSIIVLIVYSTFAKSFLGNIFDNTGKLYVFYVFLGCLILFFAIYLILKYLSRKVLKFNVEDTIVASFCGSKKSMTHGTVFGKFLFLGNPNIGLYFLPLMIYHASQIFILSIIAQHYAQKKELIDSK